MSKPRTDPQTGKAMIVSDLDDVATVLADEKMFCEQCGAELPLWPPEGIQEHTLAEHRETMWDAIVDAHDAYKADTDLVRRRNFQTQFRAEFVVSMLRHRRDLYEKLVAAGVIRAPAQG